MYYSLIGTVFKLYLSSDLQLNTSANLRCVAIRCVIIFFITLTIHWNSNTGFLTGQQLYNDSLSIGTPK